MAVTKDDFEKVWASQSPLTPYSFSDSQYKEGWNFVGSTPPSRQMWDAFMQNADEKLKYLYQHEDIPLGHEYFTFNPNVPQGSLPLFGGEYDRATYSDLWNWVQEQTGYLKTEGEWQALSISNNGNVPYYSDGDGSTTFRVPSLKCWVRGANGTVSEVGSYLESGLPDINGRFGWTISSGDEQTNGAFVKQTTSSYGYGNPSLTDPVKLLRYDFSASDSNSVYGNSTTVVPESIVGMWLVKAYGIVVETGTINEQQYIDDRMNAMEQYVDDEVETGVPTGCVQAFAGQNTPTGWLLCDGSAVSRTTYAKLFSVIGTSYGSGDGSSTFNLPDLIDKFVQGNATAGAEKSAGLPNITGGFDTRSIPNAGGYLVMAATGPFTKEKSPYAGSSVSVVGTENNQDIVKFDASRSSSVYGNSTTVQPPALTMRYIIKY